MKNRIKEARERAGFSQGGLAAKMKVTRQTISSYERGQTQPRPEVWDQLATLLKVPVPFLQGYELNSPEWHDYDSEMSMLAQQDVEEDAEDSRKFIAETAQDLIEIREFGALKVLKGFAKLIRENVTNKQRVEQASDKSIIKIDPFKEADEERAHNIKSPRYHMYFLDPVQKELYSLIKERRTAGDKETADRLQKVLDKIERDNFRV